MKSFFLLSLLLLSRMIYAFVPVLSFLPVFFQLRCESRWIVILFIIDVVAGSPTHPSMQILTITTPLAVLIPGDIALAKGTCQ